MISVPLLNQLFYAACDPACGEQPCAVCRAARKRMGRVQAITPLDSLVVDPPALFLRLYPKSTDPQPLFLVLAGYLFFLEYAGGQMRAHVQRAEMQASLLALEVREAHWREEAATSLVKACNYLEIKVNYVLAVLHAAETGDMASVHGFWRSPGELTAGLRAHERGEVSETMWELNLLYCKRD